MENKYFKKADMPECPVCETRIYVIKRGKRKIKDGTKQRYKCTKIGCGKQFIENSIQGNRKYDEFIRELSIFLFDKKLWTLRRTQSYLKDKFGVKPNISTIWRWYCQWLRVASCSVLQGLVECNVS